MPPPPSAPWTAPCSWSARLRGTAHRRGWMCGRLPAGRTRRTAGYLPRAGAEAQARPREGDVGATVHEVFIEHTDAYGVVFYANYLGFFGEARESLFGGPQALAMEDRRVHFLGMDSGKWAASAKLGDVIHVATEVLSVDGDVYTLLQTAADTEGRVFMEATVRAALRHARDGVHAGDGECAAPDEDDGLAVQDADLSAVVPFVVGGADVDATGALGDVAAMRAFERGRTACLGRGGSAGLAALQEAGVLVVVVRGRDFAYTRAPPAYGRSLEVRTLCRVSSSKLEFDQRLVDAASGSVEARAAITCLCVTPQGRRARLPAAVLAGA